MVVLSDMLNILAFRAPSLRAQADRRMFAASAACFSIGYVIYTFVRNRVYAVLPEISSPTGGPLRNIANLELFQTLLFLLAVYIPALVFISRVIRGNRPGSSFLREEYRMYLSALLPMWGALFLISAPVQWIVPHFLIVGMLEVSAGYLFRSILLFIYTAWALKHLDGLTTAQACVAFVLSWTTFPVLYLLCAIRLA